jgi:hypothetical protein
MAAVIAEVGVFALMLVSMAEEFGVAVLHAVVTTKVYLMMTT